MCPQRFAFLRFGRGNGGGTGGGDGGDGGEGGGGGSTCGHTDGPTYGRMDIPSFRDARTHLNKINRPKSRALNYFGNFLMKST